MLSCQYGHELCARALIEAGAEIDKVGPQCFTALMLSASRGHDLCARALLEAGADLNMQNNEGYTALMWASNKNHELCARALLEAGADTDKELPGYPGANALAIAKQAGHTAICNLLS